MKTQFTTSHNRAGTSAIPGRKPVLTLLMRLLWATALLLPGFAAQAGAVLTTVYAFQGTPIGSTVAALVQGSNGNFYGTTVGGGTYFGGTVFEVSTNGSLTNLYSFTEGNDGGNPNAALLQVSDGSFYGTTYANGASDCGTVFNLSPNETLTTVYSFTGGNDGANSDGALVQGSDGNFYGTAEYGGFSNDGTVFSMSTNGTLTPLYAFSGNDGANPVAGLAQGSDGSFYGTTQYGGTNGGFGTLFKINTDGALTSLYSFTGSNDGGSLLAELVQGSDGYFYGTTYGGGTNGDGTVFKITTNGTLTSLYSFTGGNDGADPEAGLIQGRDGNFYGTAYSGGTNENGTVFKITTNGALTTLYLFTGGNDGANPEAALVQGRDGSFYGRTFNRGLHGAGTVFRLTVLGPATPSFQSATLTNGLLSLTWSTEAGGVYQLQYNSDLSSSNWINLSSAHTATGATLSTTDSVTNGQQRFYRLALLP